MTNFKCLSARLAAGLFGFLCGMNALHAGELVEVPVAASVPSFNAKAWALMEINSGWIVAHDNANTPLSPASITKLMGNYVLFDELKKGTISMQDRVPISEAAWRAEGSRMFADVNTELELGHLLKSTVIQSGNDASIALAEYVGGSEPAFAALMNKAGREMGLNNSLFVNSTGLTAPNHAMSARDILVLSAAIIREFPGFYEWYSQKSYTHNNITQYNRNKLLWKDSSVDGLKTGYTEAAGYCLVGTAEREGQRWLAVVLGSEGTKQREAAVLSLLEYGFQNFQAVRALDQQVGLASVRVYGGEADEVQVRIEKAADLVVPDGREDDIKQIIQQPDYIEAPIKAGAEIGSVALTLDGREIYRAPMLSMSTINEAGWWKALKDSIKLRWRRFSED